MWTAARIQRRVDTRYCDMLTEDLDEALALCESARREGRALSVGLVGNCADVLPEIVRRGVEVDVVTDQTSAHDPLNGYIPHWIHCLRLRAATARSTGGGCGVAASAIRKSMCGGRRRRWWCM